MNATLKTPFFLYIFSGLILQHFSHQTEIKIKPQYLKIKN